MLCQYRGVIPQADEQLSSTPQPFPHGSKRPTYFLVTVEVGQRIVEGQNRTILPGRRRRQGPHVVNPECDFEVSDRRFRSCPRNQRCGKIGALDRETRFRQAECLSADAAGAVENGPKLGWPWEEAGYEYALPIDALLPILKDQVIGVSHRIVGRVVRVVHLGGLLVTAFAVTTLGRATRGSRRDRRPLP